jgi:hypothetical protein
MPLNRSIRMPRNRSEMARRAFGGAFAALRTSALCDALESIWSDVMFLDALDTGTGGLLWSG